jgi:hypothetical protein
MMLMIAGSAFATIELRTLIRDIEIGDDDARAGDISMVMISNEFAGVTSGDTIYIRLRLNSGVVLSDTVVDLTQNGGVPALLPVKLENSGTGATLQAPADAIRIVRWRAGEDQIWLEITDDAADWVVVGGVAGPPSTDHPVTWRIGQTQTESNDTFSTAFGAGEANLAAQERLDSSAFDAPLLVDLTNSSLQPAPAPPSMSLLIFDPVAFGGNVSGVQTSASTGGINTGSIQLILFSQDNVIGRAVGVSNKRWISHVPMVNGNFSARLILANGNFIAADVTLVAHDVDGNVLEQAAVNVPGLNYLFAELDELFQSNDVSHIQILGPETTKATLELRANGSPSVPIVETDGGLRGWTFYPNSGGQGFDAIAAINLGSANATVTATFLEPDGTPFHVEQLFTGDDLPPLAKAMAVLDGVIDTAKSKLSDPDSSYAVRFSSSQPIGVVQLRGKPGAGNSFYPISPIVP